MIYNSDIFESAAFEVDDPRLTPVRNRALGRKQRGNRTNIRHQAIQQSRLGR